MTRFTTVVIVIALIFTLQVVQWVAIETLEPVREQVVLDGDNSGSIFDEKSDSGHIFVVVTQWSPTIASIGVLLWGLAREFLRSRTTAARTP